MKRLEQQDPVRLRRVAMFGGTFDPIHLAHLILAERACDELELDAVIFVPALVPPHKSVGRRIASAEHRVAMVERGIASNPRFLVSTHEIDRGGISYTVDTLAYLRALLPDARLTLLLGGDSARDFRTWRMPERIAEQADVAVWARPGAELPEEIVPGVPYRRIAAPMLEISSTEIRERAGGGASIRYLTPDPVVEYIESHALYR